MTYHLYMTLSCSYCILEAVTAKKELDSSRKDKRKILDSSFNEAKMWFYSIGSILPNMMIFFCFRFD